MRNHIALPEEQYYADIEATERYLKNHLDSDVIRQAGFDPKTLLVWLDEQRYVRVSAYHRGDRDSRALAVLPPQPVDADPDNPPDFYDGAIWELREQSVDALCRMLANKFDYDARRQRPHA